MNTSTPQKSKEKHKNCNSFFGINLDRETAFIDTNHLSNFISSELSKKISPQKSADIDTVVMFQKTEDAPKSPVDITRKVFPEEYCKGNVKPKEIDWNNLSDLESLVPLKVSTPRVRGLKKFMNEATARYGSGDEIEVCPSHSSFLQEVNYQSSTSLLSISKRTVGNREILRNYDQNMSIAHRLYQSPNKNEKRRSQLQVLPSNETCQNTDIILDKEIHCKMVDNPFTVMEKDCCSSMLPEQRPASTLCIKKSPKGKCYVNLPDMNMIPKIDNTTVNEYILQDEDSVSNKDGDNKATNEELILSLCNMSINQETSLSDTKYKNMSLMITIDEVSDNSDSSNILHESSDKCRTGLKLEGESHYLLDSEAIYNISKEEPPSSIEKVHASTSKANGEGIEEPVKAYMLPFVSNDPQENRDNEDPQWSFLAKLKTGKERYQFTRKLWKSIVVPDPNVDMTYFGCLRRWRAQRNASQEMSNVKKTVLSKKRKRRPEDDVGQPSRKRARGLIDINFSVQRFKESMKAVTIDYLKESSRRNLRQQQVWKLERIYQEKIHQLNMACSEVEALHKFYHGLPDQDLSVSQESVEAEQREIDQLYGKFKQMYGWDGRTFIP